MKRNLILIFMFVVFAGLLSACGNSTKIAAVVSTPAPEIVVAEGHVTPGEDLKLFFSARGKISKIFVTEGQSVKKGDMLAVQGDSEQAAAAVAFARLDFIQAQQVYDEFVRTNTLTSAQLIEAYHQAQIQRSKAQVAWEAIDPNKIKDEIDTAQTDVQDKKKLLTDAQDALDKYLDLKSDNPTRRTAENDLRKAEADYNIAVRKVEELQRSIDAPRSVMEAATAAESEAKRNVDNTKNAALDPDKKAVLLARLESARAQVTATEAVLNNFTMLAPFDGLVTDVNISEGELIGNDKFAIQMANTSKWYIETSDLTELEVVSIFIGQSVEIIPDSLPDVTLSGSVESISSSYKLQGGDILYTVKVKLNNSDPLLRWGMTVQNTFAPLAK